MKDFLQAIKRMRKWFLGALIISSLALMIIGWSSVQLAELHARNIAWVGISLLFTEALFVIGALIMAISVGEGFSEMPQLRHWPKHFSTLRKNARKFAEQLIVSRSFTIGFWMNFAGAVGTSLVLIGVIAIHAPYAGAGILLFIIIDLFATLGWRIPLEMARRKAHRHAIH